MINWINNYIDKLKKEGKKETLKKIDLKEIGCPRGIPKELYKGVIKSKDES